MPERSVSTAHAEARAPVGVVRFETSFRLMATAPVAADTALLRLEGVVSRTPSRHSIQVGIDQHLHTPPGTPLTEILDRYGWQFLNHSCAPNSMIRGRELIALRGISAWEEITFDYHTTEFDMVAPFRCECGNRECVSEVRGYAHLPPDARQRIEPLVAPHVLALSRRADEPTS